MAEITYGFVDNKGILITTAIIEEEDTPTIERIKEQFGAATAHVADLRETLTPGITYWNGTDLVHPCIYPSWTWDSKEKAWAAPLPIPTDGKNYVWNEEKQSWDVVSSPFTAK